LWPSLTIIKMDSINAELLREFYNLINKHIPRLYFSIIQHRGILKLLSLTVSSIGDMSSAIFIEIVQKEVFILSVMSAGTNSC